MLGFLACAFWLIGESIAFFQSPLNLAESTTILLKPGDTLRSISERLYQEKILHAHWQVFLFEAYCEWHMASRLLQAGEYLVTPELTPGKLFAYFRSGKVIQHKVLIPEGETLPEMIALIHANPFLIHTVTSTIELRNLFDISARNPEGYFFPSTYLFRRGDTDRAIYKHAYWAMKQILLHAWAERAAGLPYRDPYDGLIVASMIEKETAVPEERSKIAGVIVRRLHKHMRLQIDATIIYGLGKHYDGSLSRADLRKDTLYNTYTRYGLPPTPICLPGKASIEAAFHPDRTQNLYFVARGDGSHVFSDTLKAHDAAVKKYILKQ